MHLYNYPLLIKYIDIVINAIPMLPTESNCKSQPNPNKKAPNIIETIMFLFIPF